MPRQSKTVRAVAPKRAKVGKKQPQKKRAVKVKAPKKSGKKMTGNHIAALDARAVTHVPPPVPMGPYTLIRTRDLIPITTNTSESFVHVFGAFLNSTAQLSTITSGIGYSGLSGSTTTAALMRQCALMATYGTGGNAVHAALHALTVTVACTGNALSAEGLVHGCTMRQVFRRATYSTMGDLATSILSRPETRAKSAYELLNRPMVLSSHPLDMTDWTLQQPLLDPSDQAQNRMSDKLAPVVVVFSPTPSPVSYTVTIHAEWRVNFTDVGLASTAVPRPVSTQSFWQEASNIARDVAGHIEEIAGAGRAVMSVVQAGSRLLRAPLRALA